MKKLAIGILGSVLCGTALLAGFVAGVNALGGLPHSFSSVTELPVVGKFVKVRQKPEPSEESSAGDSQKQDDSVDEPDSMPFLGLASDDKLRRLCRELERTSAELSAKEEELRQREVELTAWEEELSERRESLLAEFRERKKELEKARQDAEQAKRQLEKLRMVISTKKEENLENTADIYSSMDAEQAAEILKAAYESDKEKTVVKLLYLMRERNAAETLAAFGDPALSAEITEKLSYVEEQQQQEGE